MPRGQGKRPPPPPKETRWKKGQSGNPGGKAKDPPELKAIKELTKAELTLVGALIVKGRHADLKALANSADATVLQRMLASVAEKIISKGDMVQLDILLNRLVGKVKDEGELEMIFRQYETMSDEELAAIALGKSQ